jgi:hypothetical protein
MPKANIVYKIIASKGALYLLPSQRPTPRNGHTFHLQETDRTTQPDTSYGKIFFMYNKDNANYVNINLLTYFQPEKKSAQEKQNFRLFSGHLSNSFG